MIVHEPIDENVCFRHSAKLINKLIFAADEGFDLIVVPQKRHSPRCSRDRICMEQCTSKYFLEPLGVGSANALDLGNCL
jgi:dipeptidyl-peptidase-4